MRAKLVIKSLHYLLTIILLAIVSSYGFYQYVFNDHPNDIFVSKQKLSNDVWLYTTKYDEGNATVADIYRFYLYKDEEEKNILKTLKEKTPFLETNTMVKVSAYGNTVNIKLTGKIYSFTNSELFYANGIAVMPVINIIANGTRD